LQEQKIIGYQSVGSYCKNNWKLDQRKSCFLKNIELLNKRTEFLKDIVLRNAQNDSEYTNINEMKLKKLKTLDKKSSNIKSIDRYFHHYYYT
jgi:hypothetical protein